MRLLLCFLAAGLLATSVACMPASGDKTPSQAPSPSESAASAAERPEFPELTPFSEALQGELHAIRDRVSQIRGIAIHPTAQEGLISQEALAAYGRDQFAALEGEDADDAESTEALIRLMGLAPPDFTLESYGEESANIIAGLYYFEEERLVLVGDEVANLSMSDELTLAHEYTHSLQDAKYDLDAFIELWTESDAEEQGYTSYSETLRCLIEGDAELTQRLYAEEKYGPEWREMVQEESANDPPIDFDIPEFLLRSIVFYYSDCVSFVEALYEMGGWDAVNAAYDDPPGTTEQILNLDKFMAREVANAPKPPNIDDQLDGWSEVDGGGQLGQYDVYNYLFSGGADYFSSLLASVGWGSGWLRLFRNDANPSEVAVEILLAWDPDVGAETFVGAFESALDGLSPAFAENSPQFRRWVTEGELRQHGALVVHEDGTSIRLVLASNEAALNALLAVE